MYVLKTRPCFMQAWGQPENTPAIVRQLEDRDPSRLVMGATGWSIKGSQRAGSFFDIHDYNATGPHMPPKNITGNDTIATVGEMGSIGLQIPGHLPTPGRFYTPNITVHDAGEWLTAYAIMIKTMLPQIGDPDIALSSVVYTEWTDVAFDVTGLLTYDREVMKVEPAKVARAHRSLYNAMPARGRST